MQLLLFLVAYKHCNYLFLLSVNLIILDLKWRCLE